VLGGCLLLWLALGALAGPETQRGGSLAIGASLPLHLVLNRALRKFSARDQARLWVWGLGTLLRLGSLVGVAVVVWVRGDIDPLSALLSWVGLVGMMMGVQAWVLSGDDAVTLNGSEQT
jgi:hypothetical protein